MNGEIARAVLEGSSITIKPDCYPLRKRVKEIKVSMTKWTWNGTVTLGRTISAEAAPEELDEAIVQTVKEMADTIEMPHNWKG
ncbi:MAG: hypothetical protein HDT16_01980 [Oscillibacter sp.]|nr:hypothetical protein [Oscillibacter sp.]